MASYGKNFKLKHVYIGDTKLRKSFCGDTKIWSGASIVNYYSGNELLGTREIDEGLNVLNPSIIPSKAGYTFLGWNTDSTAEEPSSKRGQQQPERGSEGHHRLYHRRRIR